MNSRLAVVLFNLGGPSDLRSVRPFLFNLFKDPHILRIPRWPRYILAYLISRLRFKKAQGIYKKMGGKSPLLENTQSQAQALKTVLSRNFKDIEVFVCMRYWHPFAKEVVQKIVDYNPDQIVLLPLYPQFSTTTTLSSFEDFKEVWQRHSNLSVPFFQVGCYPVDALFIQAFADLAAPVIKNASEYGRPLLLFSAHGLPKDIVDQGDPYEKQVQLTAKEIVQALFSQGFEFDYQVTYQSRVGPKKWLEPATDSVIEEMAKKNRVIVVLPIAFVSDHSETLVELDQDYRTLAFDHGACFYGRVPSLGTHPLFIEGLSKRVDEALQAKPAPILCDENQFCICRKENHVTSGCKR